MIFSYSSPDAHPWGRHFYKSQSAILLFFLQFCILMLFCKIQPERPLKARILVNRTWGIYEQHKETEEILGLRLVLHVSAFSPEDVTVMVHKTISVTLWALHEHWLWPFPYWHSRRCVRH